MIPFCRLNHSLPFATVDAEEISGAHPAQVQSFGRFLSLVSDYHNSLVVLIAH